MSNSMYGDEATPVEKILTAAGSWKELAKMDIPRWVNDRPVFPVVKNVDFTGEYPTLSADINYELKTLELEKIKYALPDTLAPTGSAMRMAFEHAEHIARRNIEKLRMNDIPVFNIRCSGDIDIRERIGFEYQIPEWFMYKSFFVLHDFSEAVEKSGEYAMQQVQKIIDKY